MKATLFTALFIAGFCTLVASADSDALLSFDTGYTLSKVRTAQGPESSFIVASSYEGTLLGIQFDGIAIWTNTLSGFMNQDLWCEDLTGDGIDELLAANADGSVYCLDAQGQLLWSFKENEAPMNAVCVMHRGPQAYVVCGGYDTCIYYLTPDGFLLKKIPSATYSQESPWHPYPKPTPPDHRHTANFIRKLHRADGTELLAVHGVIHSMALQARGSVYLFEPLADHPYKTIDLDEGRPLGEMRVSDTNGDGTDEILFGGNGMTRSSILLHLDIETEKQTLFQPSKTGHKIASFGYRVVQPEFVRLDGKDQYLLLMGSNLLLVPLSMELDQTEVLSCRYSFNDLWNDAAHQRILLASGQSGGSCIHLINLNHPGWKAAYSGLTPPGKIGRIRANTQTARKQLASFKKPIWERDPLPVYLVAESIPPSVAPIAAHLKQTYNNPIFLTGTSAGGGERWDRSTLQNEFYRNRRDRRKQYNLSRDQILNRIVPNYENSSGIAYWGGHGNDPYMIHLDTNKKVIDAAHGKKTVLIFPELEDHSENFATVLSNYLYPLAEHCRTRNGNLFIRSKHIFWQANIYLPMWSRLLSGEFAEVFVPAMEETTDKSMELSLAARLGIWTCGATDNWGTRCARDNTSYDRLRQFSHQELPNHFLRTMVYHVASGARYLNNFPVDQPYMSLLWELIARGALYLPKRSEIVSFSPVHLSMFPPDEHVIESGSNTKWTTFFDEEFEAANPCVFSRLNGTWPGAPVTDWDFSRYAAGVIDRRLNFLPPYRHGLVLITPPQHGIQADARAPRGALADHLHPLYKTILKEYYTDGRNYLSADGKQTFAANEYDQTIATDIRTRAAHLPLTVSGNVAWVCAQTSPRHLRLTLVDSGYINPNERTATLHFHTVKPVALRDVLDHEEFEIQNSRATIDVPLGLFRFIDIELNAPFHQP